MSRWNENPERMVIEGQAARLNKSRMISELKEAIWCSDGRGSPINILTFIKGKRMVVKAIRMNKNKPRPYFKKEQCADTIQKSKDGNIRKAKMQFIHGMSFKNRMKQKKALM